jgi:hypothetical protein
MKKPGAKRRALQSPNYGVREASISAIAIFSGNAAEWITSSPSHVRP